MYLKVEPTGCCERKGLVQVRLDFFLDEKDTGYEKKRIQVPTGNPVYEGKMGDGIMVADEDYKQWYDALPKQWITAPFHTHFIYVDETVTGKAILDIGEKYLKDAYSSWANSSPITCKNEPVQFNVSASSQKITACANKAEIIKSANLERKL